MYFTKKVMVIFLQIILIALGIVFICCLPKLFLSAPQNNENLIILELNWMDYVDYVKKVINSLLDPLHITYEIYGNERLLLPNLLESYFYTLTIIISAFFIAVFLSIVLANFTFYLPKRIQSTISKSLNTIEAIPDLFLIISVQLIIISIYKNTNWLITIPFSTITNKTYFLPIVTLSILPTIYLYKINLLNYKNEMSNDYIDLAIAKGMKHFYILKQHVLLNASISIFYNAKSIMLLMISNSIILEFLFNSFGLFRFLISHQNPEIISIGILLFMIPFYFLFEILKLIIVERRHLYDKKII
ncbi:peptide ABC transporter permease [Bacillus cereus]|nr:peptide ABC transporter permease [Bacillus cereus]PFK16980.1 peptide ABC transporter permease [Bacillus cereus]PFP55500.1 peptide ABC transporter permease [Bacillus cereus]PFV04099.1 peptide ABC transporter permease [Bacillus cereus]PGK79171.1 peptide ABC transporter permease [Bacillus cereus]